MKPKAGKENLLIQGHSVCRVRWRWASQNLKRPWSGENPGRGWACRGGTWPGKIMLLEKTLPLFSSFSALGPHQPVHRQSPRGTSQCSHWLSKGSRLLLFIGNQQINEQKFPAILYTSVYLPQLWRHAYFTYLIAWWECRVFFSLFWLLFSLVP